MPPIIVDVVTTLTHLVSQIYDMQTHPIINSRFNPPTPSQARRENEKNLTSSAYEREKARENQYLGVHSPFIHTQGSPYQNPTILEAKTWIERGRKLRRNN